MEKLQIRPFVSRHKKILALVAVLTVLVGYLAYMGKDRIWRIAEKPANTVDNTQRFADGVVGEVTSDICLEQEFVVTQPADSIGLMLATYKRENVGNLYVRMTEEDSGKIWLDAHVALNTLEDNRWEFFDFAEPVGKSDMGKKFLLTVSSDAQSGNAITVYHTQGDAYSSGTLYVNKAPAEYDLVFSLADRQGNAYLKPLYLVVCVLILSWVALLYWTLFWKKLELYKVFVIVALGIGILAKMVFPPYAAPDELSHIHTSYHLANKMLGLDDDKLGAKEMYFRQGDTNETGLAIFPTLSVYHDLFYNTEWLYSGEQICLVERHSSRIPTPLFQYFPTSLGIAVARLLRFGYRPMLYAGSFCNLLAYVLMIQWAIRKAPVGKSTIFLVALMPMAMQLAVSFSYDTIIMALAVAFVAQILFMMKNQDKSIMKRNWIILAVLTALLVQCKMGAYAPLLLLCLAIPSANYPSKRWRWGALAGIAGVAVAFFCLGNFKELLGLFRVSADSQAAYAEGGNYTIHWALHHFPQTILIHVRTLVQMFSDYWNNMIGSQLGAFTVPVYGYLITVYGICLMASAIPPKGNPLQIEWSHKVIFGLAILISGAILMLSMFIGWTPYDSSIIAGVQGRYLIPLLVPFLLLFRNKSLTYQGSFQKRLILIASVVDVVVFINSFAYMAGFA